MPDQEPQSLPEQQGEQQDTIEGVYGAPTHTRRRFLAGVASALAGIGLGIAGGKLLRDKVLDDKQEPATGDACPNLPGVQMSVPISRNLDANGNCVVDTAPPLSGTPVGEPTPPATSHKEEK